MTGVDIVDVSIQIAPLAHSESTLRFPLVLYEKLFLVTYINY